MNETVFKKENYYNYGILMVLVACFIAGYWPAFQKLMIRWDNGDNNYCYLIIPLFIYLCWDRKNKFEFLDIPWNLWGIVPIILSIGLILIGEIGSVETLLYSGLWGCVVGTVVSLYGWRSRYLIFPLLILFFIVPLPPFINNMLTFKMKMAASTLSVEMMRAVGISVMQEGNIIDLGIEQLQVVDACSGLRYFMPMVLMAFLVGSFFTKGWWRRAILLIMVVPLTVVMNGLRIFVTGLLTVNGHKELAQGLSHDFAGWFGFILAGGILVLISSLMKKIWPYPEESSDERQSLEESDKPGVGYTKPIILASILCLLFAGSGYSLREMSSSFIQPERMSFESFPMKIGEWEGKREYLSEEILNELWADDYVKAFYRKDGSPNMIYLLIPFYEYQGTRHTAHAPQACLLGGGWAMVNSKEHVAKPEGKDEVKMRTMVMEKGNSRLLSTYFFFQRGRVITSPWMNKFYLIFDSITKRRTDGGLVRIEMGVAPGQSIDEAYVVLEDFLSGLWPLLPDYVPE